MPPVTRVITTRSRTSQWRQSGHCTPNSRPSPARRWNGKAGAAPHFGAETFAHVQTFQGCRFSFDEEITQELTYAIHT